MAFLRVCSVNGRARKMFGRGYCNMHYSRLRRSGSLECTRTPSGALAAFIENVALTYEGDECLTWPYATNGKGQSVIGTGKTKKYVSRVVCEAQNGPPPTPLHEAAHTCGNGHLACVSRWHLVWKTRAENMADCAIHGTKLFGEKQNGSKLTAEKVREIRAQIGSRSYTGIASKYGVSETLIRSIDKRKAWAWLE